MRKWVQPADEQELREAFAKTLEVRKLALPSKGLADTCFFKTLVRIHRAGEGAPYTGLKPAATVEPPIAKADLSLEKGNVDELANAIGSHAESGVRERFMQAPEKKGPARESLAAGRDYVAVYVTYVHYVEEIAQAVHSAPHHGAAETSPPHQH